MGHAMLFFGMYLITVSVVLKGVASKGLPNDGKDQLLPLLETDGVKDVLTLNEVPYKKFELTPELISYQVEITKRLLNYRNPKHESAFLLYSKAIEQTPIAAQNLKEFIDGIVIRAYQRRDVSTVLDFIMLELDEPGQICLWLNSLYEVMKTQNTLASIDGLQFERATKRIAHLFRDLNEGDNQEKCSLKESTSIISKELVAHSNQHIQKWIKEIQNQFYSEAAWGAIKFPFKFDSFLPKLILQTVTGLNHVTGNIPFFVNRFGMTIEMIKEIHSIDNTSTTVVDALTHLNQILHNVEPYSIGMPDRILLAESFKKITSIGGDEFPLAYQQQLTNLKKEISLQIQRIDGNPTNNPISLDARKENLHLICFFNSLASQTKGRNQFTVEDIDPKHCTHLVYHKAIIDNKTLTMTVGDKKIDIIDKGYEKIIALKQRNPLLKVMIALSGLEISDEYMKLHSESEKIKTFVESAVNFLQRYKFDGIHLDLDFLLNIDDNEEGTKLMTALNDALRSKNYLFSATASVTDSISIEEFGILRLNQMLDFISVMAFSFHGNWENQVNHHAPLFYIPGSSAANELSVDYIVGKLIREGVSPQKIIVGIPLFGVTWALKSKNTKLNAPAFTSLDSRKIRKPKDEMAYNEICKAVQNDEWQVFQDPGHAMGPYAVAPSSSKPRTWVGYDDPAMAVIKANYILLEGLGGAYVWDVSMDDFRGTCGGGTNPMLTAIATTLNRTKPARSRGVPSDP